MNNASEKSYGNIAILNCDKIIPKAGVTGGRASLSADGGVRERMANGTNTFGNGIANPDIIIARSKLDGYFLQTTTNTVNGTLRVNFNQLASLYDYKTNDTTTVSFTTQNEGTVRTTYSHGDLLVQGGKFGSLIQETNDNQTTYGSFRFTNLEYKSGTIILRLKSESAMDSLDLTGYWQKTEDTSTGTTTWSEVAGGSVTKIGNGDVTFDFGTSLDWLIDSTLNDAKGVKIISWDASKKTELAKDDFYVAGFNKNSIDYVADFSVADDGLYVKYVQVPEAGELAAIIGVFALLFSIRRKMGARKN